MPETRWKSVSDRGIPGKTAGATRWWKKRRRNVGRICRLSKRPLIYNRKMNGFYITVRDETEEQRESEAKLYNARHDRLTGLFSRDYLYDRVKGTVGTRTPAGISWGELRGRQRF